MSSAAIKFLLAGVLLLGLSLPLALRVVPMNHLYGFRTRAAFESPGNWYEINSHGGRLLAAWSLPIIAVGVAGLLLPEKYKLFYIGIAVIIVVVCIVIPILAFAMWHRRFEV